MKRDIDPVRMLPRIALLMAVVVTLANVALLVVTSDVAVLRQLELLRGLVGAPGVPRLFTPLAGAPAFAALFDRAFVLRDAGDLIAFLAFATALTGACYLAAALLAMPLVALLWRWLPPRADTPRRVWFWGRAYPLALLISFAAPLGLLLVHALLATRGDGALGLTGVGMVLGWVLLVLGGPSAEHLRRWLRRGVALAGGAALVIGGGAVLATAVGGGPHALQPAPSGTPPNVLLISIDSLRADHVHAYGYARETTPTLDRLAAEGVRFRTVVSPTSWTLPAHLTLLTALPPERHGVVADGQRLTQRALFLSEVLWQAGYTTVGFVSAPYLDAEYGFSQGFDHYDDYTIAKRSFEASHQGTTAPILARLFGDWLAGWDAGGRARPFFAFLHLWDVHYDYRPPPPYDQRFDPDYRGDVTADDFENNPRIHPGMDPRDLAHVIALYDGEIGFTDEYLGHILDLLRQRGLLDNTLVVVTADHGDEFFEHGRKGHKQALYDESILVPLIMRYPARIPAGRVVDEQVRLMDVGPTILGLVGITAPPAFGDRATVGDRMARDLRPWIDAAPGGAPPPLPAYSDLVGDAPVPIAALRTPEFKLIEETSGPHREELYALDVDPGERVNRLASDPRAAEPLRQALSDWRLAWTGEPLSEQALLSPAHRERLRALGYAQ